MFPSIAIVHRLKSTACRMGAAAIAWAFQHSRTQHPGSTFWKGRTLISWNRERIHCHLLKLNISSSPLLKTPLPTATSGRWAMPGVLVHVLHLKNAEDPSYYAFGICCWIDKPKHKTICNTKIFKTEIHALATPFSNPKGLNNYVFN